MPTLPLIKCKHVKWVKKVQLQAARESLVGFFFWWVAGIWETCTLRGAAFCARATPSEFIKRTRRQRRTLRLRTWWVTVVHRRASENIYVGGKAVIIKFEEFTACKQPSNRPSEWDGVMHSATLLSTCLCFAIYGKMLNVRSIFVLDQPLNYEVVCVLFNLFCFFFNYYYINNCFAFWMSQEYRTKMQNT